jgi:hypothetical protein
MRNGDAFSHSEVSSSRRRRSAARHWLGHRLFHAACAYGGRRNRVAAVARIVVLADFLFTATAVVAQSVTGMALAREARYRLTESWIVLLHCPLLRDRRLLASGGLDPDATARLGNWAGSPRQAVAITTCCFASGSNLAFRHLGR